MAKGKKRRLPPVAEDLIAADPLLSVAQFLVLLKVVLILWVFDPNALDAFALPKSAVSHAIGYALAGVVLALVVRHRRDVLAVSAIHLAAAVLLGTFAVASLFALDTTVALYGTWRRYLGLTQVVDNFILFMAAAVAFRTTSDRGRIGVVGLVAVAVVAAYAFLQRLGLDLVHYQNAVNAIVSTLGQPDVLGAFSAVAAITTFGAGVLLWDRLSIPVRTVVLGVGAAALAVALVTGVRSGALGLASGWMAIVAVLLLRPQAGDRRLLRGMIAAGAILAIAVVVSPIGQRLAPATLASDPAIRTRLEMWDTAFRIVVANPLLGVGPDNFANAYPALRSEQSELLVPGELQNSTHSWFWYAATSGGVLGAAAMLFLAAVVLARGVALARLGRPEAVAVVPVVAYLGQGLVGVNDLSLDWIFWLAAGVLAGTTVEPAVVAEARRPITRLLRSPGAAFISVVVLAVLAVGAAGTITRVGASRSLGLGQAYLDTKQGAPAVPLTREALAADPRRPEYWASYGAALAAVGADPASVKAFIVATELDPTYPAHWRNLAIELGRLGNIPGAYLAVQRAVTADPYNPASLDLLAQLALSRGDQDRAATAGAEAAKLDPETLSRYDAPIFANLSLQRWPEAERLLAQAFDHGADKSSVLRLRRAQLYAATGRKDLALQEVDAALILDPKNADAVKLKQDLTK